MIRTIFLLIFLVSLTGFAKSSLSVTENPKVETVETEEDDDSLQEAEVEYELVASNKVRPVQVRADGLTKNLIQLVNTQFALYGYDTNPLSTSEARRVRDRVSQAQLYYKLRGMKAPEDVRILLMRANTLYQNTANPKQPPPLPRTKEQIEATIIEECKKSPNTFTRDFYLAHCT